MIYEFECISRVLDLLNSIRCGTDLVRPRFPLQILKNRVNTLRDLVRYPEYLSSSAGSWPELVFKISSNTFTAMSRPTFSAAAPKRVMEKNMNERIDFFSHTVYLFWAVFFQPVRVIRSCL